MAINTIEEEEYIDIKALRKDLLDDLYAAAHVAHFGGAYIAAEEARRAWGGVAMKCPRCGGDMSSGVCSECGFPETIIRNNSFFRLMIYFHKIGGVKNGTF